MYILQWEIIMYYFLRCTGGDLFHSISADPFSERESVFVLKQVIDALTFLHKKFIIHLDIKVCCYNYCTTYYLR